MTSATKSHRKNSRKPARTQATTTVMEPAATPSPSGKLGLIIDKLASKRGATADELVAATGWQRHSVLGALSKLKARGFEFHLDAYAERKAYRLTASKG
ncbi:MAG: DUF3489 domain-containing protein [Alphaproteobacteria bacterium]|nr:DUF3489 domain-containing protein [Alphaproteobacteria bacterium]